MVAMNFRMFLHLIHGLRDDCVVKDLSLDELDIYLTKSDGKVGFGVMDKNQKIIDYFTWNGCL